MSQEKIESRRAFMKILGKTVGAVAATATFLAVSKTVEAASSKDAPETECKYCSGTCIQTCTGTCCCTCYSTCYGLCKDTNTSR